MIVIPFGWLPYPGVSGEMGANQNTAANGGYFRFANLGTARALWDGTVSAGDRAVDLRGAPRCMMFTVTGQDIRFKLAANPTATEGLVLKKDVTYYSDDDRVIRMMRIIETTASAEVSGYYFL